MLMFFIYQLIWTLSFFNTFVSNTKIYPRVNECTFSWHNEHPDVPQLECTIWQVKLNIISPYMFCMNGNAIDVLLKLELYSIKLDGKLTLCLKYVSIIRKLPILNLIYFIVLICDAKKSWHTSPSNSACCRTRNNLMQWNLFFKTWNIQRNNPFCQWSTYITTCIWRMSEQKCLQNIMWTCSHFLIHSRYISLVYLVE